MIQAVNKDASDRPGCQVIAMYFVTFVWGRQPYTYDSRPYYKVEIAIYDDRIEIEKPGMLPPQLTPETIKH